MPHVGYISFRSLLALILALVISAWFGERFIKYLKRKQITETQRDSKIDPFGIQKIGVPSMGGVIIIVAILVPVLLLGRMRNIYLILMIVTTLWLGFLGVWTTTSKSSAATRKACRDASKSWDK